MAKQKIAGKNTDNSAAVLAGLAEKIKKEHESVIIAVRKGLDHAKKAGDYLIEARPAVEAGGSRWEWWVETHAGLNHRTASNYRKIAENWADIAKMHGDDVAGLTIRAALNSLKVRPAPAPKSKVVTVSVVSSLIEKYHVGIDLPTMLNMLAELGVKVKKDATEPHDEDDEDEGSIEA